MKYISRLLGMKHEKQSILYCFLISKKIRAWRHILLFLVIIIIAINGIFGTFGESYSILGNKIYWIVFFSLIIDLVVIYFNLYVLVPKLLLQSKYLQYIIALFILVLVFILVSFSCEYYIFKHQNIAFTASSIFYSGTSLLVEFLYSFILYTVLIISVSMTALFKSWLMNLQRISQLETAERRTQLENMKEKISPWFLSRMLRKSASLAILTPQKASEVLLKLSKILRYQLYDCSREKVLLNAEIDFLTNYLDLEKEYYENFDFKISRNGDMLHVFIPPLLFLPFIQKYVMHIPKQNDRFVLELQFSVLKSQLLISCIDNGTHKMNYDEVDHRLQLLFRDQYTINFKEERELIIQIDI